ncbi:hypothetical protein F511_33265 [Dorcoceras hygrometricum]|uniref:Uncharacterized protein n=1 Tax=Dorcoceras hygrometricum TaxID=472368 RepID=A0A2Z7BU48_9LAMI|nr:hypothetical protein F511_33265 [Dorcoceras hygrometricum]
MTSAEFSNDDVSRISNLQQNSATMTSAESATLTVIFSNVNKQNSATLTGKIQQRSQQNSATLFSNVYKQFSCQDAINHLKGNEYVAEIKSRGLVESRSSRSCWLWDRVFVEGLLSSNLLVEPSEEEEGET